MFFHGVVAEFIKFVAFYIILKALVQFINIEARRSGSTQLAGAAGLLA